MATYAARSDLDDVYGSANIDRWADLNNTLDATDISNRVTWALDLAEDIVNGHLRRSFYTIPFTGTIPEIIKFLTALKAGLLLYEGRRIAQDDRDNQVSAQEKTFKMMISDIVSGRLTLATDPVGKTYPIVGE